ncbi:hypothetical protein SASPL_145352 [Salvia splendens]|uniref:Uncharacterized protein n=1 Tax=Salvia splendens TaxID=180675 RepID=A0A8X8WGY2_SALSN|nr:hypothetical protein SASPL_145352 [Salvia splendens]
MDRDNVQRALRDRVAQQDALDESVRSKTAEVEALQGVVADLQCQNRNLKCIPFEAISVRNFVMMETEITGMM